MQFFSRTWTTENSIDSSKEEFKEGFKAFLYFEEYICAPPYGEQAYISKIFVAKFNKADLSKKVGKYAGYLNDKEPGYWHNVYGDNDWRVAHTPITWENIPENILSDLYNELSKALEFAIVEEE